MHLTALLPLLLPLPLSLAHFQLLFPPPRGYTEDTLSTYPCGGQNTPSPSRVPFPLHGGPIQLNMEHDRANVQVVLAPGNDAVAGDAFTITLVPLVTEEGFGKFCLGQVVSSLTLPGFACKTDNAHRKPRDRTSPPTSPCTRGRMRRSK